MRGVRLAEQRGGEVLTVEFHRRVGLHPRERGEGRGQVDAGEDRGLVALADPALGHQARGPDDERGADPALEELGLVAPEGSGPPGARFRTIVGAEYHDRVVAQGGVGADALEDAAELAIHLREYPQVERALARRPLFERREIGAVHVVGPEVDVERLPLRGGRVDEAQGRVGEAGGHLGAVRPRHRTAEAFGVGPDLLECWRVRRPGQRQELWSHALEVGQRGVKAVAGDRGGVVHVALSAEMPFAEVTGRVAGGLQGAAQGGRGRVQPLRQPAAGVIGPVAQVGSDPPTLRVLAGEQGATRRRADRRVHVELGERQPLRREAVDVRGLGLGVAEAGEVAPAQVIDEHEQDVRARLRGPERRD